MFIQFLNSSLHTLLYVIVSVLLVLGFLWIYTRITPYKEFSLIMGGNRAAAWSVCGALLGFILPLCSVIAHSSSIGFLVFSGIMALLIQVAVFFFADRILQRLHHQVERANEAAGIFLGAIAFGAGCINAACLIP